MRDTRTLLAQIMGYMDSGDERTRTVAFEKARTMLAESDTSFAAMYEASLRMKAIDAASGAAPSGGTSSAPIRSSGGSYIHPRTVGRFARTYNGKTVIRKVQPPFGIPGRVRILSDVKEFEDILMDMRLLTLSFETADHLFEPFTRSVTDPEWLATVRNASADGSPLVFTSPV
jgi:hypothetical protein